MKISVKTKNGTQALAALVAVMCGGMVGCSSNPNAGEQGPSIVASSVSQDELKAEFAQFIESAIRDRGQALGLQNADDQNLPETAAYYADFVARAFVDRPELDELRQQFKTDLTERLNSVEAGETLSWSALVQVTMLGTDEAIEDIRDIRSSEHITDQRKHFRAGTILALIGPGINQLAGKDVAIESFTEIVREGKIKASLIKSHPAYIEARTALTSAKTILANLKSGDLFLPESTSTEQAKQALQETIKRAENNLITVRHNVGLKVVAGLQKARVGLESRPAGSGPITYKEYLKLAKSSDIYIGSGKIARGIGNVLTVVGVASAAVVVWDLVILADNHYAWVPQDIHQELMRKSEINLQEGNGEGAIGAQLPEVPRESPNLNY